MHVGSGDAMRPTAERLIHERWGGPGELLAAVS
jgi:hypothetical protein